MARLIKKSIKAVIKNHLQFTLTTQGITEHKKVDEVLVKKTEVPGVKTAVNVTS